MKNFGASDFLGKVKQIIFLGVVLVIFSLALGLVDLAKGIFIGGAISIFNFYIVASAVNVAGGQTPRQAQVIFMRRAFARMIISCVLLLAAVPFGIPFLIGVTLGLVLQMLSYTLDAVKLAVKGVKN